MNWFIEAFKNTFNFRGRARRAEFGWFNLINFFIQLGLLIVAAVTILGSGDRGNDTLATVGTVFYGIYSLYGLMTIIPTLSVTVRRLHDLGWSGWWLLWSILAPFVLVITGNLFNEALFGILIILLGVVYLVAVLMLYFKDGQRAENKYGTDPKAPPRNTSTALSI